MDATHTQMFEFPSALVSTHFDIVVIAPTLAFATSVGPLGFLTLKREREREKYYTYPALNSVTALAR